MDKTIKIEVERSAQLGTYSIRINGKKLVTPRLTGKYMAETYLMAVKDLLQMLGLKYEILRKD